jgi:predicted dehydrogenase
VNGVGALAVFRHDAEETDLPEENGTPGAEWPLVSREILNEVVDVEDISMMSMQLHNGTLATYQQCHFSPDTWHSFTVIGSRGRMENVGEDTGGAVIRVWNRPLPYFNPWGDEQHPIHRELQTHAEDSRMMAGFVAFLRGAETPVYTPVDARNAVAAADLATRSIRDQGDSFEIPRVDERVADFFGKP